MTLCTATLIDNLLPRSHGWLKALCAIAGVNAFLYSIDLANAEYQRLQPAIAEHSTILALAQPTSAALLGFSLTLLLSRALAPR